MFLYLIIYSLIMCNLLLIMCNSLFMCKAGVGVDISILIVLEFIGLYKYAIV